MHTQLVEILKTRLDGCRRLALLGVGSELRGDDAAGVLVVREMRELLANAPFDYLEFEGFEGANAPENVTGYIKAFGPDHILLVDAAEIGASIGECREIAIAEISETLFSTHTLPMKVVTDYLEQATGAVITVLGMQPGCVDFDAAPTPEIRAGVETFSHCLYELLREFDLKSR
ncbi:MAG: hydrogenase 3 maturation endopeptidase HyCI [Desulfuromonadales bacterium]|nr:hydrogenase 3 maturation endopeptidase HyCI [Desulfuromonadales bacterium]